MAVNLWGDAAHANSYLERGAHLPYREEGTRQLLEHIPSGASRILDLGTGDGRIMGLIRAELPDVTGVAADFSDTMLSAARDRFAGDGQVAVVRHDLDEPLPDWGAFDVVVSGFAIHHVVDERKQALYGEIFDLLVPDGMFFNLEHVASPSERLHSDFLAALDIDPADDDPSNKLVAADVQLGWLRGIGFTEVDCHWRWREMALLGGVKPG